ncbi:MAG: hypothetical protein AABX00_00290 [Nanoarchaeota archaeon]
MTEIPDSIEYKYGKEGEKIVCELFKDMGFEVNFVGVEHRKHFIENISARDIYSPDLKLYDSFNEQTFYVEIKSLIISRDREFIIDKELLLNYFKYYPENSFLVLYIPENNKIGMKRIKDLATQKFREITLKDGRTLLYFKFETFNRLNYYARKHHFSYKFGWNTNNDEEFDDKIESFLKSRQDRIRPLLEEFKLIKSHSKQWNIHTIKFKKKRHK